MAQLAERVRAAYAVVGRWIDRVPWADIEEIGSFVIALMPATALLMVGVLKVGLAWEPLAFIALSFYGPYRLGYSKWQRTLRKAELAAKEDGHSYVPSVEAVATALADETVDASGFREMVLEIDAPTTAAAAVFDRMLSHIEHRTGVPRVIALEWSIAKMLANAPIVADNGQLFVLRQASLPAYIEAFDDAWARIDECHTMMLAREFGAEECRGAKKEKA